MTNQANPAGRRDRCSIRTMQDAVARFSDQLSTRIDSANWFGGLNTEDGKSASNSNPLLPSHCIMTGVVDEHIGDPNATRYGNNFKLRIPAVWNGRYFFQGGGGNNGTVGNTIGTLKDGQNALSQGYAVVTQDSGHVGREATFALDRTAYIDFAFEGVHEVSVVTKALIKAYAGQAPDYSYFVGCSNGGREAMVTAQRYDDFDGVVAGNPGLAIYDQWVHNLSVLQVVSRVAGTPAGTIPTDTSKAYRDDQLAYAADYFMAKCDRLDGATDGVISNYQACKATVADYRNLLCKAEGGENSGTLCLSTVQTEGLKEIYSGLFDRSGKKLFPGFLPGNIERSMRETYLGTRGTTFPLSSLYNSIMPNFYFMGYGFQAYPGLTGPANWFSSYPASSLEYVAHFDVNTEPVKLAQGRLDFHGYNIDPARPGPNFEGFRKRGGKMLIYTGTADPAVQATGIMEFMDRLNMQYTPGDTADMAVLFMIPGMNHCRGGATTDQFDQLAPLVAWVEKGIRPEKIIAKALPESPLEKTMPGISRPLCPYPKYARYQGNGSLDTASNFVCVSD